MSGYWGAIIVEEAAYMDLDVFYEVIVPLLDYGVIVPLLDKESYSERSSKIIKLWTYNTYAVLAEHRWFRSLETERKFALILCTYDGHALLGWKETQSECEMDCRLYEIDSFHLSVSKRAFNECEYVLSYYPLLAALALLSFKEATSCGPLLECVENRRRFPVTPKRVIMRSLPQRNKVLLTQPSRRNNNAYRIRAAFGAFCRH